MTMKRIDGVRRTVLAAALAAAVAGSGCAAIGSGKQAMQWSAVTHVTKFDTTTGAFAQQGVAMFKDGEVAQVKMDGNFLNREGTAYTVTVSYKFADGSTLAHKGSAGRYKEGDVWTTKGRGEFVSGTGRFAGISGTTTALGRTVSDVDGYVQFTAEYVLPRK